MMNADLLAAILGVTVTLTPAFVGPAAASSTWDAFWFSCCFWIPLLSLPAIRQKKAGLATAINSLTFIVAFQMNKEDDDPTTKGMMWRPFCAAMACFSTLKACDLAADCPNLGSAKHCGGLVFFVDTSHRKKVMRCVDCFKAPIVDVASAAVVAPMCVFLFGFCGQFLSTEHCSDPTTTLAPTTNWMQDAMLVCCRCSLVGIGFGHGLGSIKLTHQLIFLPCKIVPAQPVMNNVLASSSLGEFWSHRWNYAFHSLLKRVACMPLLKSGKFNNKSQAQLFTFAFGGLFHAVLLVAAGGSMTNASFCLSFFVCQGLLIHLEKKLFPSTAAAAATAAATASPTKKNNRRGNLSNNLGNRIYALMSLFCAAPPLIEPVLKQKQSTDE